MEAVSGVATGWPISGLKCKAHDRLPEIQSPARMVDRGWGDFGANVQKTKRVCGKCV